MACQCFIWVLPEAETFCFCNVILFLWVLERIRAQFLASYYYAAVMIIVVAAFSVCVDAEWMENFKKHLTNKNKEGRRKRCRFFGCRGILGRNWLDGAQFSCLSMGADNPHYATDSSCIYQ